MINTRVTLDGIVGPYDCVATEEGRAPRFTLDVVRQVSAGTLQMADDYGYTSVVTVHVIDGHAGSPDTVHVFDSGEMYVLNEDGERAPRAVAVRVRWRGTAPTVTPVPVNRETRRAARKTQKRARLGRGAAARAAVICVPWEWVDREGSGALDAIAQLADGRYPIGGYEWPWDLVAWECVCGYEMGWHGTDCLCGLTRDSQPEPGLAAAAHVAGTELRKLAPEATSALVDLHGLGRIVAVYAGDREIDTADDTGPFDTETLGAADEILRAALDGTELSDLAAAGWEHVPDADTDRLYRITFAPAPSNPPGRDGRSQARPGTHPTPSRSKRGRHMTTQPASCPAYEIPAHLAAAAHAALDADRAARDQLGRAMLVTTAAAVRDILTGHEPGAPFDASAVELLEGEDGSLFPTGRYWTLAGVERTFTETVGLAEAGNGIHGMSEWTVYLDDDNRNVWGPLCAELPERDRRPAWALDLLRVAALKLDDPGARQPGEMVGVMVCANDEDRYPAMVDPDDQRDGYVRPWFDLDTVRRIAATTQADAAEYGHGSVDTVHVVEGTVDGTAHAVVMVVCWMYLDGEKRDQAVEVLRPNADGRYAVGGHDWCWYALDGQLNPQIPFRP